MILPSPPRRSSPWLSAREPATGRRAPPCGSPLPRPPAQPPAGPVAGSWGAVAGASCRRDHDEVLPPTGGVAAPPALGSGAPQAKYLERVDVANPARALPVAVSGGRRLTGATAVTAAETAVDLHLFF